MNLKKYIPYLAAFAIFALVCILYFKPQYEDMALRQSDMVQVSGMTADVDKVTAETGKTPQWTGSMFGGMPTYTTQFEYKGRVVKDIAESAFFFLGEPASYIFVAMSCFFLMLLMFGVNPWLGIIGGLAYGLSSYFLIIVEVGHITKMVALAYAPAMMGGIYMTYRRNMWLGALFTAIFTSLVVSANHPQIVYYFAFAVIALAVNEAARAYKTKAVPSFFKRSVLLIVAAIFALGSNFILLYYLNSYSKHTMRGGSELVSESKGLDKSYATEWSYGKMETLNLFIPNLMGGASTGGFSEDGAVADALTNYNARNQAKYMPGYWGDQRFTMGPVYIGAVVVFLFVLAMFVLAGASKWWIFAATALSILLAWGQNLMWFTDIFFNYVPLYNKFRTVSMILVIAEWALPLLAILVLQKIWVGDVPREKFKKGLQYSVGITGGIALFFLLFGGLFFDFVSASDANMPQDIASAMSLERASLMRADSLRSLLFVLLTAGAVWAFYMGKLKKTWFIVAMCALVLVDMVGVGTRYLNYDTFVPKSQAVEIKASPLNEAIMQDKELGYRVANLTVSPFQDATTSYFHRSIGGYNGAKLSRYQDIIDRYLSKMDMGVYSMLNTKYFIASDKESGAVIHPNPYASGAAWFVESVEWVDGAKAEIDAIDQLDFKTVAVVDNQFKDQIPSDDYAGDSTAVIALTEYSPDRLIYSYTSPRSAIAVFSEVYYAEGWSATIDGKDALYFRADYILRGMVVPEGEHTIEFKFEAPRYTALATLTYVCSLLLIVGLVVAIVLAVIKSKKKDVVKGE